MLPLVLGLHVHEVSAGIVLLVGLIGVALATVGFRSARRSGNAGLRFVALAFALFGAKGLFASWAVYTRTIKHEHLELVLSIWDLVILTLLAVPLLGRGRSRRMSPP